MKKCSSPAKENDKRFSPFTTYRGFCAPKSHHQGPDSHFDGGFVNRLKKIPPFHAVLVCFEQFHRETAENVGEGDMTDQVGETGDDRVSRRSGSYNFTVLMDGGSETT